MKSIQIIACLFLMLLLSSCTNRTAPERTDLEELNLNGEVKSVKIYTTSQNEVSLDSIPYQFLEFNSSGFGTLEASINPISGKRITRTFELDDDNYLLAATTTDESDKILRTETYYYDENLLQSITIESGDVIIEYRYEYNENDSIKKIEQFTDAALDNYITYEYDTLLSEKSTRIFNNQDVLNIELIATHDRSRNMIIIKSLFYNEMRPSSTPMITSTTQFYMDESNNIELKITYGENGAPQRETYEYEYDHMNNWTTQKVYREDSLVYYVKRKIEYYE